MIRFLYHTLGSNVDHSQDVVLYFSFFAGTRKMRRTSTRINYVIRSRHDAKLNIGVAGRGAQQDDENMEMRIK